MTEKDKEMFDALHPDPNKKGARVTKATFDLYRAAIVEAIPDSEEGIGLWDIPAAIEPHMPADIIASTSPMWWTMTVKLDLEARGIIERVKGKGKQRLRKTKQP